MTTPMEKAPAGEPEPAIDVPLRFVTAASLFDGHDAAITIMRRIIQDQGAEVVHLGHDRSVAEVVRAALQEDADGVAISSYQGGHLEYFRYLVDSLAEAGAGHVRVFGGGGGTITREEIAELEAAGVERLYHPDDGLKLGLTGMIEDLVARTETARRLPSAPEALPHVGEDVAIGRLLTAIEDGVLTADGVARLGPSSHPGAAPVVGITGTGGSGKSSVIDELVLRFLSAFEGIRIGVLAVDPTRRRTGGALLGDRIRMNTLRSGRVFFRSMATRRQDVSINDVLAASIRAMRACGFDLIVVETAGIGQGDSAVVELVDVPVYVMTSEYGAASQLEKIDMIDFADLVILNKFDRRGGEDALRDVRKQWRRNRLAFDVPDEDVPVYPTIASHFHDDGLTRAFEALVTRLGEEWAEHAPMIGGGAGGSLIPGSRARYLAEIAEAGRDLDRRVEAEAEAADAAQRYWTSLRDLGDPELPEPLQPRPGSAVEQDETLTRLRQLYSEALGGLSEDSLELLRTWPSRLAALTAEEDSYRVRGKEITVANYSTSLSGTPLPRVAAPRYRSWGDLLQFLHEENTPGAFPFTAGVYPYRRQTEDPTRMFAGEGPPERTNRRFHYLAAGQGAARLSTAFDSVTLYGEDPATRPDVYGKVGNSGVSVPTLDDMKRLYSGFDLCAPTTSVSMTINGPAPIILAMFFHTAIDQQVEKHLRADTGRWQAAQDRIREALGDREQPVYRGELPEGNDGLGLGLLGLTGAEVVDAETYARIAAETLAAVRGTVQADILKEDQAQNTCIFGTEFALRMMGDIQQYFIDSGVRNFYSVSISGYHIAEAGANPITQLAFTLANGFTIVEYYLARGMAIDDVAPHLSFFFSNGMNPEYSVIGRVARRIWARAMRDRYGASARGQMLKYHIQTSGRSLHAQEIEFNDIRTTLQALYASFDACNSLHTNAYDEAVTTPTEESVRRAVAIQLILAREFGLSGCENPWQGSFIISELTDLVEQAVYTEFDALSRRGGVLGAMESMYQRGKIQDESMVYERRKHDGSLPVVGVNTFLPAEHAGEIEVAIDLVRSSSAEKDDQVASVSDWQEARNAVDPDALNRLQEVARTGGNTFAALMEAVRSHSLGQITHALYEVGGEYRRSM
ncbi:MAG TPA: methylmalonyl-CoA mutase family protein [Ruania sp.]|nr:methylmalonyl-CoA mutase family protein [Ruania sp.]